MQNIPFNSSGIPQKLKEAILIKANLKSGCKGFYTKLNDKLNDWFQDSFDSLISPQIPDLKITFNDNIADNKSLRRWWGEEKGQRVVSVNIDNLNLLCLFALNILWDEFVYGLSEDEKNFCTDQISNKKNRSKEVGYFKRYLSAIEKPFRDDGDIDYTRSFNLLLFMFGNEKFKEFRSFDMAFDRWKQLVYERSLHENYPQIKNYPKDIMHETEFLCTKRRCLNFRRICVVPEWKIISDTKTTVNVLKLFLETESRVRKNTKDVIFETRILLCTSTDQYNVDFDLMRDFAMFSDEPDEFAIVETSLNNPYEESQSRICKLMTNEMEIQRKKERFDWLWDHHTISLEEIIKEYGGHEVQLDMIKDVIDHLNEKLSQPESTAIIIETAYVGLMNRNDNKKRISHYDSAYELIKQLSITKFFNLIKNNIYVNAFVNDFSEQECVDKCPPDGIQKENSFHILKRSLTREIMKLNLSYCVVPENVNNYFITNTRNKVTKRVKKLMKDTTMSNLFIYEETSSDSANMFVYDRNDNKVFLGYKKGGAIVPNCTLIMAEHYYELFDYAYLKNPNQSDFWIIDFLQHYEITSCEQGIEVASLYFPRNKGVKVNIVNCNYSDDDFIAISHLGPYQF